MNNPFITLENLKRFLEHLRLNNSESLELHTTDYNNPHKVTKVQIGLPNVDNTSDSNKPVSIIQKNYIDTQDNMILTDSKMYTDLAKTSAIDIAANDTLAKTNVIQNSLTSHIANVTDAHDIANRLQALKVFMTDYVNQGISNVVGGAPEILNTLRELSNAIGNDPNLSVTLTNLIGQKLDSLEVVSSPIANKILRLNASAQYPASVIAQDMNNRFFTDAERTKLAGIAAGATNYTHPINHPPSIIIQDSNNRFVTDTEKSVWNGKQNALSLVTQTVSGIMSSIDKLKLDDIEDGANKTIITNNLTALSPGTALDAIQGKILNDTKAPISHASTSNTYGWGDNSNRGHVGVTAGNGLSITNGLISMTTATTSVNGAFSATDKLKLDGIQNGATNYTHPLNHSPSIITQDANNRFVTDVEKAKWNSIDINYKSYTDGRIAEVYSKQPVGSKGQVYYIKNDNSSEVQLSQILTSGRFVETAQELASEIAKVISFGTIFNTWERFSIPDSDEKNSWSYNSATDQVSCTVNSVNFIGFVSLDKYDNYTHEATLSSNVADDDMIGLMIAYYKDSNGKVNTLHATRSSKITGAGLGPAWGIIYNWNQADAVTLYQEDTVLRPNTTWDIAGATRLRITRTGDIITCETTAFGNTTTYLNQYKYTIDLTSNPLLDKFRGPKQYGYVCQSQQNSTFTNIVFSDISSMIFDIPGNKVYTFKSGAWSVDPTKTIMSEIGPGRLISNPTTGKLFFIKDKNTIIPISAKPPGVLPLANGGTGVTTKPELITLLMNAGDKYSTAMESMFTFVFESGGNSGGYISLPALKMKLQWTTAELQAALSALPNI